MSLSWKERSSRCQLRRKAVIARIKAGGCMRCHENHPAVLEFHHRNPAEKVNAISNMFVRHDAMSKILEEVAKCDLLCANCHAKEHWKEK